MAKEFVMGARINMGIKQYLSQVKSASQRTKEFKSATDQADKGATGWRKSQEKLRDEMGRFVGGSKKAKKETEEFNRQAKALNGTLSGLKRLVGTVFAGFGVKKAFDFLVGGNADMETYRNTLTVVMKDQQKANDMLEWATTFAAKTPFEIPGVVEATTRLTAYGIEAKSTLGIVGDMAAVMGKDLMQAVEAVADAQTGELERLKEFGITKKMIEDQAKLLKVQVVNNKGQITDQKAFNAVLFSIMEDRFKGGMELQSTTFKGMLSNLQDFIGTTGRELGAPIFDKFKEGLGTTLKWLETLEENGSITTAIGKIHKGSAALGSFIGSVARKTYTVVMGVATKVWTKLTEFYEKHKPQLELIGLTLINIFTQLRTYAGIAITWLTTTGLPGLVDLLTTVGGWVINVATWFIENWEPIKPIVTGLVIAWGSYVAITKTWIAVTKIMAAVQGAFNLILHANPIGLVVTGIGLLIGAGILLYKNWEKVKQGASDLWIGISNFFKKGINSIIDDINSLIRLVNKIPGVEIGEVKKLSLDMSVQRRMADERNNLRRRGELDGSHRTGLFRVPFDGYRAELHKGERILTAAEARSIDAAGRTKATGNKTVTISKLFDTLHIEAADGMDEETLADKVIEKFYEKLTEADDVLGNGDMEGLLV